MNPEVSAFLSANGTVVVLVVGALAAIGLVQWRKIRVAEQELEYKQRLLEKGLAAHEIDRAPARRGLLDQFSALSGGAKTGIVVGFVVLGIVAVSCLTGILHAYAFWSNVRQQQTYRAPSEAVEPPAVPRGDAIQGHVAYLDLQPLANQRLTAGVEGDTGHSFAALSQKRQEFCGVPFQIGPGYVRLRGKNHPELPAEAKGVRVGMKFDKLHIFHGTEYGAFGDAAHRYHVPEGTEIGKYRVRYADKSEVVIPIVYGADVRDVWNWDRSRATSRGLVAWTGKNASATREGVTLRVYLTTWQNPKPGAEIVSIDYASEPATAASPFCIALTAERAWK